jgi:hypothetical protein
VEATPWRFDSSQPHWILEVRTACPRNRAGGSCFVAPETWLWQAISGPCRRTVPGLAQTGQFRVLACSADSRASQAGERLGQLVANDLLGIDFQPLEERLVEKPPLLRVGDPVGRLHVLGQRQGILQGVEDAPVITPNSSRRRLARPARADRAQRGRARLADRTGDCPWPRRHHAGAGCRSGPAGCRWIGNLSGPLGLCLLRRACRPARSAPGS